MKLYLRFLVVVFLLGSCNSQKTAVKKSVEEYIKEGYTVGTISQGMGDCTVVISVDELNVKYDPINIQDEEFAKLASKKGAIFFKFLPLRMKNRCKNVSPIRLIEAFEK